MEQVHGAKDPGQEEEREEVRAAAVVEAVVSQQDLGDTAFVRTVGKGSHINWERPALNSNVPSVGPP